MKKLLQAGHSGMLAGEKLRPEKNRSHVWHVRPMDECVSGGWKERRPAATGIEYKWSSPLAVARRRANASGADRDEACCRDEAAPPIER